MNSVGSQLARAVKVWLRDTAPLSFTHRALLRLVTRTVLTLEDRQINWGWGGDGWGGGGGGVQLEYSPSLTVGRTSSTATNCSSKVWKIRPAVPDLHNEAQQSLFAHLLHVSQGNEIYILKFFFYLSHFASTTEGSLLGSNFSTQGLFTPIFRHA